MRHREREVLVRREDRLRHRRAGPRRFRERLDERREVRPRIGEQIFDPASPRRVRSATFSFSKSAAGTSPATGSLGRAVGKDEVLHFSVVVANVPQPV